MPFDLKFDWDWNKAAKCTLNPFINPHPTQSWKGEGKQGKPFLQSFAEAYCFKYLCPTFPHY